MKKKGIADDDHLPSTCGHLSVIVSRNDPPVKVINCLHLIRFRCSKLKDFIEL